MKRSFFFLIFACLSMVTLAASQPDFQDGNLYYKIVQGNCYVYGLANEGPQKLVIPSTATVNGRTFSVTGIMGQYPNSAGYSFPGVKEIVLPNSVKFVGSYAFISNCLERITMDGVTQLEDHAFYNCGYLKMVSCRNVQYIGTKCFYQCESLKKIIIPSSCSLIEESVFFGCTNSDFTVIIEDGDTPLKLKSSFIGCQGKRIYIGRNLISWHNGIYEDDLYFFREVDYGDNVTNMYPIRLETRTIYRWDFDIHHLVIGASIEQVPNFYHDENNIDSIHMVSAIPPAVNGRFSNRTYIYGKLYVPKGSLNAYKNAPVWKEFFNIEEYDCQRLTVFQQKAEQAERKAKEEAERKAKLEAERKAKAEADRKAKLEAEKRARETLNVRVTGDIPPHAYEDSKKYKYIVINDGAKKIGCAAFKGCENVMSIDLPSSINTIGDSAFMNCTNLTSITLPVSVGKIGRHVFEGCTSLTSITLPRWLKEIGYDAFSGCTSLTSITLPNGLKEIDGSAFSGCTSLTSITLPNSLKEIGYDAFSGCTSLTSITLPNGLTEIGWGVFRECKSLTSVIIPNSVTSIGRFAFSHCTSLSSITIPSSVTEIKDTAFWGCSNLTSITIPNSVTKIGKDAFHGCSNLNLTLPKKLKGKVKTKDCKSVTYYK